jgi:hypothetical protein
MAIDYPSAIDVFTNPSGTSTLDSPDHALQHSDANDAIEAIEAVIGTTAGTSVLKDFSAGEFAVRQEGGTVSPGTLTFDSPTLGTPAITGGTATGLTLAGTPVLDATSAIPFYGDSMSRQAIINGNFDVWQRGTTSTNPANNTYTCADRWKVVVVNSGTLPTNIVHSRQTLTSGDLYNSFYHYRIAPDGAGSGFGATDNYMLRQSIEYGVRTLCGDGKKVTVSFYARSSIANKKLGVYLTQYYGSGGSPSTTENLIGTNWTLTSTWTKYTYTFTTNTLASKTFGTANDDQLMVNLGIMWGSTKDADFGADGAETFGGSGNIDIAQVQLCAGDVALPFMPKSFEEELRACQRYYEIGRVSGTVQQINANANYWARIPVPFKVTKRTATPTLATSSESWHRGDNFSTYSPTLNFENTSANSTERRASGTDLISVGVYCTFIWTAENEL